MIATLGKFFFILKSIFYLILNSYQTRLKALIVKKVPTVVFA